MISASWPEPRVHFTHGDRTLRIFPLFWSIFRAHVHLRASYILDPKYSTVNSKAGSNATHVTGNQTKQRSIIGGWRHNARTLSAQKTRSTHARRSCLSKGATPSRHAISKAPHYDGKRPCQGFYASPRPKIVETADLVCTRHESTHESHHALQRRMELTLLSYVR